MRVNDEMIDAINRDPVSALTKILGKGLGEFQEESGWSLSEEETLFELSALLDAIIDAEIISPPTSKKDYEIDGIHPNLASLRFIQAVHDYCAEHDSENKYRELRGKFASKLEAGFAYEFSKGDEEQVQQLLNELRELISDSTLFESAHKRRLLSRLERLQSEMHKRMSDLDHFWGLVGDAGVAMGKFGSDAKPFVDRIRELTGIVWRTQGRAEELPSDAKPPLLDTPDDQADPQ